MQRTALIVWGGWDGHQPKEVGELFADMLGTEGFTVDLQNTLDAFIGADTRHDLSLIVPIWTMGQITPEQRAPVERAVANGVGIAGCHGGMCDAFRADPEWQFLTGGQWVAHPGDDGVRYTVNIDRTVDHEITHGLPDFEVQSEQYYLHTDPGNQVLATCDFPTAGVAGPHTGNPCKMPTVWTKGYGKGRVFYCALGHNRSVLEQQPTREIMRRGFLWAAS